MSYLAYILISLLAFIYAVIAWKLYPHFVSIKDQIVKSKAQLYWGRFAASWGVFAFLVIFIRLDWSDFDAQVHSIVSGPRYSNTESGPGVSPGSAKKATSDSETVPKPVEQVAAHPTPQPLEDKPGSEISQTVTPQVASSEDIPQQPLSQSSTPEMKTSASSETFAPSFDCAKASTGPERLICSNQQLASLDVQLMEAYRKARNIVPNKNSLKSEQIDWTKNQRDACSTVDCMVGAYKMRLQTLEAITP